LGFFHRPQTSVYCGKAAAFYKWVDETFRGIKGSLLSKVDVDFVSAQQRGQRHLFDALELFDCKTCLRITRLVIESIAELPIAKLLGNNAFKKTQINK
jgi:hypothetical protein